MPFKSIATRVANFKQFYARKNPLPLFGFFLGSEYPILRYPFARGLPTDRPLQPEDFDIDSFVENCITLFSRTEACGGDFIYAASAYWGIPWLEAMIGAPVFASPYTGSLYAEKPECCKLMFSPSNPWAVLMKKMLQRLACRSNGRFPLGTTRMRGIADLLNLIYGTEELLFAMLEQPEKVKKTVKLLTDLFIECGKFQLAYIPEFHGGIGSFYYENWAPQGSIWHQEDATALLSPQLYREFIAAADEKIVQSFSHVFIHQHSCGFVPTAEYMKMGMYCLELHIDSGGPTAEELYERHLAILREKPLLIWGNIPEKDLDWIFNKLPVNGLAVNTVVYSPEKATELWNKYMKNCK